VVPPQLSTVHLACETTKQRNREGSTVSFLQFAHSNDTRLSWVPSANVIRNFGRGDAVDRDSDRCE
jgi:hypothetical protein